jgi:hypothetical protein
MQQHHALIHRKNGSCIQQQGKAEKVFGSDWQGKRFCLGLEQLYLVFR